MTLLRFYCDTVPREHITMLTRVFANGILGDFLAIAINFGYPLAKRLAGKAKIATGNELRGFHPIKINLFDKMPRMQFACFGALTKIEATIDAQVEIPDIPTYVQLEEIAECMRLEEPEHALNRLVYWLWTASHYAWMHLPIFIMDHERGEWFEYKFAPLTDVRNALSF